MRFTILALALLAAVDADQSGFAGSLVLTPHTLPGNMIPLEVAVKALGELAFWNPRVH